MRCFKKKVYVYDISLQQVCKLSDRKICSPQHIANVLHTQYVITYFLCFLFACGSTVIRGQGFDFSPFFGIWRGVCILSSKNTLVYLKLLFLEFLQKSIYILKCHSNQQISFHIIVPYG